MSGNSLQDKFHEHYTHYLPALLKDFLVDEDEKHFVSARYSYFEHRDHPIKVRVYNPGDDFFWLMNSTVIEVLMVDSPFIVDTVLDYCASRDYRINTIIQPVFMTDRDEKGNLRDLGFTDQTGPHEAYLYLEINRLQSQELTGVLDDIRKNLEELMNIVSDFPRLLEIVSSLTFENECNFHDIAWMKRNFVFLGMAFLNREKPVDPLLGIFRNPAYKKDAVDFLKKNFPADYEEREERVTFLETTLVSKVDHKRPIYFGIIKNQDTELLIAGHFTRRADLTPRSDIPFISRKMARVIQPMHIHHTSHMYKEILNTSIIFPLGMLSTRDDEIIIEVIRTIFQSLYSDEPIHHFVPDPKHNMLWALGIIPSRDAGHLNIGKLYHSGKDLKFHIREDLRHKYQEIDILLFGLWSDIHDPSRLKEDLETIAPEIFTSWRARFRHIVENRFVGNERIHETLSRFMEGITPDYEIHQEPEETLSDLIILESLNETNNFPVRCYEKGDNKDYIKIYSLRSVYLSELIPEIIDFGFEINGDYTLSYRYQNELRYVYVFTTPRKVQVSVDDRKRIARTLSATLNKLTTSEKMNRLSISASLTLEELNLIKALSSYLYQIDKSFSRAGLRSTLIKYATFTRALIDLFHARLDPRYDDSRIAEYQSTLNDAYSTVESAVDEAMLKIYQNIVDAIVRTNYYDAPRDLSFKIRCAMIQNMPHPSPLFEIFVYAPDMEGVHLRSGKVSRGGLRWSDRTDDYRQEILGLMKAQKVKNTIIVPAGSKGGFVIKRNDFKDRDEYRRAGVETYQRYITALLRLTDNYDSEGRVVPAADIRRHDEDDPYLVVAADKGTATFSDIANEIALDKQFWLHDGFASGGKNGYDHKVQGITARGAWEAVKRHFYEMGMDPEKDPILAVGIGDMSGDVFGNGMLLSKSMKLIAAFNHLYIFLDPDPDPETSFQERQRLFGEAKNWNEYNTELISHGGGIFNRSSRKIKISKEIKSRLGIKNSSLSGEELIREILKAPVDLLWNGGIGTYVKSEKETHFEAGDTGNDRVRINGQDVRAKVIGEGGNLGLTQAGRIEAARIGVRLNTDAVDNSGGVDMSDHEVNLKILLGSLLHREIIKNEKERIQIIRNIENDMIERVLANNYDSSLALSLEQRRLGDQIPYLRTIIRSLIRNGYCDRLKDRLPLESELDRLADASRAPSRPEIASLMGYIKLAVKESLHETDELKKPFYDRYIIRYFPPALVKKYEKNILAHQLKTEIIITAIVNDAINHGGITFFERLQVRTGKELIDIAATYARVSEFLDLASLREKWSYPGTGKLLEIRYAYIIDLFEKVFTILEDVLLHTEYLEYLNENGAKLFRKILDIAIGYSHYRPSKDLRSIMRKAGKDQSDILHVFQTADVLTDSFNIYAHRYRSGKEISVQDYFEIMEEFRISELRDALQALDPASSWEEPFLSRIHRQLQDTIFRLLEVKVKGNLKDESRDQVMTYVTEILNLSAQKKLTASAFYEILHRLDEQI